ncbi:MAG: hypothetical protein AB8C84_04315 [Oligoflexales bacterium]
MRSKNTHSESSFTLLETVIAIGVMVTVILEVAGVHGRAIDFAAYGRRSAEAIYLAKAKMSEIEYAWSHLPFSEIKTTTPQEQKFDEVLCSPNPDFGCDYTFVATIQDWKLPLLELFAGDDASAQMQAVQEQAKKIFGDSILKIASVEVFWADGGATRDSVVLTTLLTNQKALDDVIHTLPSYPPKNGNKKKKSATSSETPPPPQSRSSQKGDGDSDS